MSTTESARMALMTIDRLDQLDALPVGAMISDHGRLAAKAPTSAWLYSDGRRWVPSVPVQLVGIPDHH